MTRPKFPDCGERALLGILREFWLLNSPTAGDQRLVLHLFQNDINPDQTATAAIFSEVDYTSGVPLDQWGVPLTDPSGISKIMHPCIDFVVAHAPCPTYGWYLLDLQRNLIGFKRTANTYNPDNTRHVGAVYTAWPVIQFRTEF